MKARGSKAFIIVLLSLVIPFTAFGQTIRFCPSADVPVAFNPATKTYEEGASFDPLVCADEPCIELLHNIFEPLISVSKDQILEPQLATGWERLDEVTFRFRLRQGVTFHNGEPFDAEAVYFSLIRTSQVYGKTAWFPEIARIDMVDPYTVDVILKKPDSLFLYRLGHIDLIQPSKYFREVGPAMFSKCPIGTGAFQFVRWDGKQREVHLEANPHYWRQGYPKINSMKKL
jgi:peptide/nickel transport system substrate-binding protein